MPAIEDAKLNAEANNIKNCEFVCGKVGQLILCAICFSGVGRLLLVAIFFWLDAPFFCSISRCESCPNALQARALCYRCPGFCTVEGIVYFDKSRAFHTLCEVALSSIWKIPCVFYYFSLRLESGVRPLTCLDNFLGFHGAPLLLCL